MKLLVAYAAPVEGRGLDPALGALELGVGKVAAATTLARRLATRPAIDAVLLFGICGAYPAPALAASLAVLDCCVVVDDVLADDGVAADDGWLSLDQLHLGTNGPFAADPGLSGRIAAALGDVPRVRGATVSTCSGTDDLARRLAARTGAGVESMEGAAIAFVCRQFGVPMAQLRCVSNRCGARANAAFNIAGACERVRHALARVVQAIA